MRREGRQGREKNEVSKNKRKTNAESVLELLNRRVQKAKKKGKHKNIKKGLGMFGFSFKFCSFLAKLLFFMTNRIFLFLAPKFRGQTKERLIIIIKKDG